MENVNDIFAEFAACFAGTLDGDGEVVYPERLNRGKLDYSLPSLEVVDEYLSYLHENRREQMGREWVKAVLWGGAYVGEVIRHNAPREIQLGRLRRVLPRVPRHHPAAGGGEAAGVLRPAVSRRGRVYPPDQ